MCGHVGIACKGVPKRPETKEKMRQAKLGKHFL